MVRSFFSGISGLQAHLERMDVIGDNLANTNTTGFKKANMTFKEFLSQTLNISQAPTATLGGTNPKQIGLGVKVGSINIDFSQGQLQRTGRTTDLALEGTGFFIMKGSGGVTDLHYSRAGVFDFDKNGNLVDPGTGFKVQGWNAAVDATTGQLVISPNINPIEDVKVQLGQTVAAKATTEVTYNGNLDATNDLAIDPVTISYVRNDVSRSFNIEFRHTHPTKPFFYYTAKWTENPPSGFNVGDAVIDANTGKALAGILELATDGTVKQNFINTDDSEVANAQRTKYLDTLGSGSTIALSGVRTIEHGTTDPNTTAGNIIPGDMAGYWRITFDDAANLTRYKIEFSSDFNPGSPSSATWSTIAASGATGPLTTADFTITDDTADSRRGQVTVRATDWSGQAVANDVLYFRTKRGNDNLIFDFPMEEPKTEDDWPELRASDPVQKAANASGVLTNSYVNVDDQKNANNEAGSTSSLPDVANGFTQTIWRAVFGGTTAEGGDGDDALFTDDNTYKLYFSRNGGTTWFDELGLLSFNTATDSIADFYTAARTDANGYYANRVVGGTARSLRRRTTEDAWVGTFDFDRDDVMELNETLNGNILSAAEVAALTDARKFTGAQVIQSENWSSTLGGDLNPLLDDNAVGTNIHAPNDADATTNNDDGHVFDWRVSYAKSTVLNRDFFTIEETTTRLQTGSINNNPLGTNVGSAQLSSVTVAGSAPVDTWTITFTSVTTYTVTGTNFGSLGTGNVGSTFTSQGLTIESGFWTGTAVAADTVRFVTESTKVLSDFAIPSGNSGNEALSFSPNTTDTSFNEADSGQTVKAKLKPANEYQFAASVNVFDSLGAPHNLKTVFERVSQNEWLWSVDDPTPADPKNVKLAGFGKLTFDKDGKFDSANSEIFESEIGQEMTGTNRPSSLLQINFDPAVDGGAPPPEEGATRLDIAPDFKTIVQFAAPNDGQISAQDGFGKGTLQELNVNLAGIIVGLFDNGQAQELAQVALGAFVNPAGLLREGNSYFRTTGNSGTAVIGVAQTGGRGNVIGGALEGSNVDLAVEFTEMIVTQRGFQANSRTIRTADQMIQEILTLKQ
ncbi:flagellar hook-basal body complex protein [bacterium]|nr:flagellar hook-basal body complex protein [bacterium]